jgi:serine/threonine-protein kinase
MAPELLRGRRADPHTDLWALGVVFFEMVAGYRPFRGSTVFELAAAILGNQVQPLPASVPLTVRQIIDRCLCASPIDRFASARDLASALEGLA